MWWNDPHKGRVNAVRNKKANKLCKLPMNTYLVLKINGGKCKACLINEPLQLGIAWPVWLDPPQALPPAHSTCPAFWDHLQAHSDWPTFGTDAHKKILRYISFGWEKIEKKRKSSKKSAKFKHPPLFSSIVLSLFWDEPGPPPPSWCFRSPPCRPAHPAHYSTNWGRQWLCRSGVRVTCHLLWSSITTIPGKGFEFFSTTIVVNK